MTPVGTQGAASAVPLQTTLQTALLPLSDRGGDVKGCVLLPLSPLRVCPAHTLTRQRVCPQHVHARRVAVREHERRVAERVERDVEDDAGGSRQLLAVRAVQRLEVCQLAEQAQVLRHLRLKLPDVLLPHLFVRHGHQHRRHAPGKLRRRAVCADGAEHGCVLDHLCDAAGCHECVL
jgi:hypothetical protein